MKVRKPEEPTTVSEVLRRFADTKQKADHLKEVAKDEQQEVVGVYKQDGRQSHITDFDDETRVQGTLVETSRVVIDEERLKKALGYEKWMKVTSPQLDKEKLEDAVSKGLVDPNVVAECSENKPNSPYIRLTWKKK